MPHSERNPGTINLYCEACGADKSVVRGHGFPCGRSFRIGQVDEAGYRSANHSPIGFSGISLPIPKYNRNRIHRSATLARGGWKLKFSNASDYGVGRSACHSLM